MLGLPLTLIDVDLVNGDHRQPAFLQLNRFAQVPVIDDGGTVVATLVRSSPTWPFAMRPSTEPRCGHGPRDQRVPPAT